MERPLNASPVVLAKFTDLLDDIVDVVFADDDILHALHPIAISGFGRSAIVEHDLDQSIEIWTHLELLPHYRRKDIKELG